MSGRYTFARNLKALLGVHAITARRAFELTEISPNNLSAWLTETREPSLGSMEKLTEFFEVDTFALLSQDTALFVRDQLGDVERFERVEAKIRSQGKVVPLKEPGELVKDMTGELPKARRPRTTRKG